MWEISLLIIFIFLYLEYKEWRDIEGLSFPVGVVEKIKNIVFLWLSDDRLLPMPKVTGGIIPRQREGKRTSYKESEGKSDCDSDGNNVSN